MSREMWNSRYATDEFIYGVQPNEYFKEEIDRLPPGRLLLPAEGEGRNAVYAASAGWEVTAIDQSEEGRRKAMILAGERKVNFRYDIGDILTAEFQPGTFDCIGLVFVHLVEEERKPFHQKVVSWLKPGGTLIMEVFSKDQLQFTSGGPKVAELLYERGGLEEDFRDLAIERCEKLTVVHDEGSYHRGEASVIRVLAKKR